MADSEHVADQGSGVSHGEVEGLGAPGSPSGWGRALGRRAVLGSAGALVAGSVVAAVSAWGKGGSSKGEPRSSPRRIADHRVSLASGKPRMVVARGPSPSRNIAAAVDAMGGIGTFVKKGEIVLIKPNIGWERVPAQAANTDPELVVALIHMCRDAGAKEVYVSDVSCNDARRSYHKSGIEAAAKQAGARVVLPEDSPRVAIGGSGKLGAWEVPELFLMADRIINVPVAKHHGLTQLTCAMKNWFGALHGSRRALHSGIDEVLVELESTIKPTLHVVDANRVLMRNGPTGGNLADVKELRALAVSVDPVAADSWAAEQLGFSRSKVTYLALAEKRGLGKVDWSRLKAPELTVG